MQFVVQLGAGLGVALEVRFMGEHARALQDNVDGQVAPGQLVQVLFVQRDARLAVNDEAPALGSDVASVTAVDRVVLQQLGELFRRDEIVDRRQLERSVVDDLLECGAPDPAQSIDRYSGHGRFSGGPNPR
jgi:hypothetical protein